MPTRDLDQRESTDASPGESGSAPSLARTSLQGNGQGPCDESSNTVDATSTPLDGCLDKLPDMRKDHGFGARLKEAMTEAGFLKPGGGLDLARLAGHNPASKTNRAEYEKTRKRIWGYIENPNRTSGRPDDKIWMADALSVSAEWLERNEGEKHALTPASNTGTPITYSASLPIMGWYTLSLLLPVGLSQREFARRLEEATKQHWEEEVAVAERVGPGSFAIQAEGDSMSPDIKHGTICIIDPTLSPERDDWVLIQRADSSFVLRELAQDGGVQILRAANNAYPVMGLDTNTIVGVVHHTISKSRRRR